MGNKKIFKKDFILMVIGQIISIFGNGILRFAMPLYLLDVTNSPSLFGIVSALSLVPMILLTPFGGIIADRVDKKKVMVVLDFLTASLMSIFMILMGNVNLIVLIIITLMILYGIQGTYAPSVQASVPILVDKDNLLKGNAIINQVNALANLLSPIIGGVVYGFYGLIPILICSICCFIISGIMEIFMKIPYVKREESLSPFKIVSMDFKESINFIIKEKPVLFKTILIISAFNLFLTSLLIIGIPVIITNTLGLSSEKYGFVQGAMGLGGLVGGIMTGVLGNKLKIQKSHIILLIDAMLLFPIGLVLMFNLTSNIAYIVILICCFLTMIISTMFSIQVISFIQGETRGDLIGKVISFSMAVAMATQPIGQILYGSLFEMLQNSTHIILFGGAIISLVIAVLARKIFFNLESVKEINKVEEGGIYEIN